MVSSYGVLILGWGFHLVKCMAYSAKRRHDSMRCMVHGDVRYVRPFACSFSPCGIGKATAYEKDSA